jgi:hypothetical protein
MEKGVFLEIPYTEQNKSIHLAAQILATLHMDLSKPALAD